MGVENSSVVDFVGVDSISRSATLTIADSMKWDNQSTDEHIRLLQSKIYKYLDFISSGELIEKYPDAEGRLLVIQVVGEHALNEKAAEFYEFAKVVAGDESVELKFRHYKRH